MPNRRLISCTALALTGLLSATAADAQSSRLPPWTLATSVNTLRVGDREGWGYGPEIKIRRDFGSHWGAAIRASLPVFGGGAGGAAIDAGPTYTWATETSEIGVGAGGTGFLVGSSSELVGGGIGAFLSLHGTAWLSRQLGVIVETETRFTFHDELHAYPGVSAGLAVRF